MHWREAWLEVGALGFDAGHRPVRLFVWTTAGEGEKARERTGLAKGPWGRAPLVFLFSLVAVCFIFRVLWFAA